MRRAELITAAILAGFGLLLIVAVIPQYVAGAALRGGLAPAFMPYVAASLATAAALGALWAAWRQGAADGAAPQPAPARMGARFVAAMAAVLVGAYVLMSLLGYLVGAAALVAGTLTIARARWPTIAIASAAAPLALWLLLAQLLGTPLP